MVTLRSSFACLALATLAGTAGAQSTSAYVSGLLHDATGAALFAPVEGRRLTVKNIGVSGEDGVEIKYRSARGGGVAIDAGGFTSTAGGEIKIRHKGWDGLIYGTHRMISNGDGTGTVLYDYSEIGAIAISFQRYNELGELVLDETFPGPIVGKEWVPNNYCADGSTPIPWGRWVTLCNSCSPVWVEGWMCPGTGQEFSYNDAARTIVKPILPAGTPFPADLDAMMISASGVSSFAVQDADMGTFGVQSWGVGDAHLVETCTTPDCSQGQELFIENLGSSGEDGVTIDVGSNAGETTVKRRRGNWDMKENTKFTDEQGARILEVHHGIDGTGQPVIQPDFSGIGASGYVVQYYGSDGTMLGSEWKNNYDGTIGVVLCPEGYRENWKQAADGSWYFSGCDVITGIVIPGQGPIGPVAYMSLTPVGAEYHRVRSCTITGSSDGGDMVISDVEVTPACNADFDHTGFVDTEDYDAFVRAFEEGTQDADFDGSGFVDIEDFTKFVHAFEAGC